MPKLRDREPSRPRCTLSTHTHAPRTLFKGPLRAKGIKYFNISQCAKEETGFAFYFAHAEAAQVVLARTEQSE